MQVTTIWYYQIFAGNLDLGRKVGKHKLVHARIISDGVRSYAPRPGSHDWMFLEHYHVILKWCFLSSLKLLGREKN